MCIGIGAVVLHPLSILMPMNEGQTKWDNRILACFPEGARKRVKEICDREDLCLYFCSPTRKSGYAGLYINKDIYIDVALDRFSFLKVFVHELAHHEMYKMYYKDDESSMPEDHGKEFQSMFRSLFEPFLTEKIFPPDLLVEVDDWTKHNSTGWEGFPHQLIEKYCKNRALKELPEDTHFRIPDNYFDNCFHGYIKGRYDETSAKYLCLGNYGWFLFDPNKTVKVI